MAVHKAPAQQPVVDPELFLALYEKMLRAYYVEEQCRLFVRAGKCSFYASARGHEKVQIAMAMLLERGKDWFFPYYREKALMIGLGMPLDQVFQGMLSRQGDPNSLGRNMSEHFSSRELRVVSPTACTGTEFLIAVGMAKAVKAEGRDEIVYVSGGEGSTSEGEYFEALNKAQHDRLPVLFVTARRSVERALAGADEQPALFLDVVGPQHLFVEGEVEFGVDDRLLRGRLVDRHLRPPHGESILQLRSIKRHTKPARDPA